MKWASTLSPAKSNKASLKNLVSAGCQEIKEQLAGDGADLVFAFVSPSFNADFPELHTYLKDELNWQTLVGCTAGGLIGGGRELEHSPGLALAAANLPDVKINAVHLEDEFLPDLDAGPQEWEKILGVTKENEPVIILLPDPFTFRIDNLVQGLDFAFPRSVKLGGLASGANSPGANCLFLNDKTFNSGALSVSLSGNLQADTIVAQGCRPVGRPLRVTKCDRHILYELDGKPAVEALHAVLKSMPAADQDIAKHALFLGVVMNEFKDNYQAGDFLVRNLLGLEPKSGALFVGELLREERTVQFHIRDASSSAEDLRSLLKSFADSANGNCQGALLFSCLGRGEHLYGIPDHDSHCFQEYLGKVPLAGFFCNGEIGPVGGTTFLHGYTSSFGIFRPRPDLA